MTGRAKFVHRATYITQHRVRVLKTLLGSTQPISSLDIARITGLRYVTIHWGITRFMQAGWVEIAYTSRQTRHYRLTALGRREAAAVLLDKEG
jgi:predicted ArsR family transcriptional regulator